MRVMADFSPNYLVFLLRSCPGDICAYAIACFLPMPSGE